MREELIDDVQNVLKELLKTQEFFAIAVYKLEGKYAVRIAAQGASCDKCDRISLDTGNIGLVARTGQLLVIPDVSSDPNYRKCFSQVRSEIIAPVISKGTIVGVIDVEMDSRYDPSFAANVEVERLAERLAELIDPADK
jgi:putative methionine-R-sulfoxide reductase with GAF domain